jgi:acyl-CoA synthetase (AMP-forming)/AMP-acid ligase II
MSITATSQTLTALLDERAQSDGNARAFTFLTDSSEASRSLTYAGLYDDALAVAGRLAQTLTRGDRALVAADDAIEFIRGFMGCQLAGVIAVPVVTPSPFHGAKVIETVRAMVASCDARAVVTAGAARMRERVVAAAPELARLEWVAVDTVARVEGVGFSPVVPEPDDVAFLQYTSGSTSAPKGVVITNSALQHNVELLDGAIHYDPSDTIVSWLPLFHDLGLTTVVIAALYAGIHAVLMSPLSFAQRPVRWLEAITRYGGTLSGGPDFAFAHCVRWIPAQERVDLDLRGWRVAYSGGEPVRAATLDAFAEAFGPQGFDPVAWSPGYGLAECTVAATLSERGTGATRLSVDRAALERGRIAPGTERTLIGCGRAWRHRGVEIVDPVTREPVDRSLVCEIWLSGPDVGRGYWGEPEESAAVFGEYLNSGQGPFLRTGDLGFVKDGELFVTGRLKDLLIVAGRNYYPQDLEMTASDAHSAILERSCAAFALERDGREQLIVLVALRTARERVGVARADVTRAVRGAIAYSHGVAVDEIVLVERKSVLKTSSGKVQRAACRELYERGELRLAGESG